MLAPVGMAMLFRVFPPEERIRASSILTVPTTLAPALGPVLGGLLVTDLSWRWVFYVNVPIGAVALIFGLLFLDNTPQTKPGRFDVAGFLLSGVGLGLLMYGISEGPVKGWHMPDVLATIAAGLVLLVLGERGIVLPAEDVRAAVDAAVFLHEDRVGAVRHRCAGEDADSLAGFDGVTRRVAGGDAVDDGKACLAGLRETIEELPDFVRVAAETGVKEVHLQRLVFFNDNAIGLARPDQALYEKLSGEEAVHIDRAAALAKSLGVTFSASGGATEPGISLKRAGNDTTDSGSPWSLCRRPWTVMYFTANGRALPCCIAPFSQRGYENYTLGDATQQTLREIWTGPAYGDFRKALLSNTPPDACASCGLRWSL